MVAGPEVSAGLVQKLKSSGVDASVSTEKDLVAEGDRGTNNRSIIVVGPGIARDEQFGILERYQGTQNRLLLYVPEYRKLSAALGTDFAGLTCIAIPTSQPWPGYVFRRRALDIIIGLSVVVGILLPLTIVLGPIIKLTSAGPVFYATTVIGQGARRFTWRKYRSMRLDEHSDEAHRRTVFIARKNMARGKYGSTKVVDNTRITLIGRILRKTSIDELPQFLNILTGDMTMVGPRPSLPYEFDDALIWQKRRAIPKSGITGVWGVYGRSSVQFDEQCAMDICGYYRRSTIGDIFLIIKTIVIILRLKGAE